MILMATSDPWDMSASSLAFPCNSLVPRLSLIPMQGEAGPPCNAMLPLRIFTVSCSYPGGGGVLSRNVCQI